MGCEVEMDDEGPLKDFFKEMEEIKANVEKVNAKVTDVKKLQSEILNSPTVDKKQNQQMDDLMAEIKKLANNVRTRMKKIEQENLVSALSDRQLVKPCVDPVGDL